MLSVPVAMCCSTRAALWCLPYVSLLGTVWPGHTHTHTRQNRTLYTCKMSNSNQLWQQRELLQPRELFLATHVNNRRLKLTEHAD